MESQNGEELDFDFDFLFYYVDRNCLTRPTMVTIDDELYVNNLLDIKKLHGVPL